MEETGVPVTAPSVIVSTATVRVAPHKSDAATPQQHRRIVFDLKGGGGGEAGGNGDRRQAILMPTSSTRCIRRGDMACLCSINEEEEGGMA